MGLGPLSISGAASPFTIWGWVPLPLIGRRIYCRYLAPWSTHPPSTAHSMCGFVPGLIQISGAGSPFAVWGYLFCGVGSRFNQWSWVPFQAMAESPCTLRDWIPFQSVGRGPLLLCGAGTTVIQWGWVPFYSVGLRLLLFSRTEYHRWWSHGVDILCRLHLCAGGGPAM